MVVRTGEKGTEATDGNEAIGGDDGFEIGLVIEFTVVGRRSESAGVEGHVGPRTPPDNWSVTGLERIN